MRKWFCVLIPVLVLFGLIGWRIQQKRDDQAAQAGQRAARAKSPASVAVAPVQIRDVVQTLESTGNVEAPLNVKIAPKITGRIDSLTVREGDRVSKGQVLVRIDPSVVEAQVRQAEAAVAEAQYRLAQARLTQNSSTVGITSQIRQQKAGVNSASADFKQVQTNYEAQQAAASAAVTDTLGRIESAEASIANAQAAIASAEANLANSKTKYERISSLYKQGFVAAQDVDDAKAVMTVQEAAVQIARGQLRSAKAQRDSAGAQKKAAEQQAQIVKAKGAADIEASRAKLDQARASSDYAQANTSQNSAYIQSIAALKAGVEAAKAALRSAQAQRADTVLRSPLDGFVTGRYVDPGSIVTSGQPALAVQFMHQVWVTISVPEESIPKIHLGGQAKVDLDAFPGRTFTGSIIQINPSADPQSRQFTVRVILDNKDNQLHPGMFARVALETERVPKAIAVPREAVQRDRDGEYVMVVTQDNLAQRRPVVTGPSEPDFISITEGVRPGEKVVTISATPLRDGQPIRAGGKSDRRGGPKGK